MQYSFAYQLNDYFPGIMAESYQPVIAPLLTKGMGNQMALGLRNRFSFSRGDICIEYLGRDLGAVLRTLRFIDNYMTEDNPVYLVCIIEEISDFYFFYKSIFPKVFTIPNDNFGLPKLMFILKDTLSTSPKLFTLDADKNQIRYV